MVNIKLVYYPSNLRRTMVVCFGRYNGSKRTTDVSGRVSGQIYPSLEIRSQFQQVYKYNIDQQLREQQSCQNMGNKGNGVTITLVSTKDNRGWISFVENVVYPLLIL